MTERTELLKQLLERFKFRNPVPDDIKKFVLNNKANSLISVLKSYGEYSIVYRLIIKIYYLLGKSGIGLTIAQSKFILAAAALLFGASLSAGAAVSYNYLIRYTEIKEVQNVSEKSEVSVLHEPEDSVQNPVISKKQKQHTEFKENTQPVKNIKKDISPVGEVEPEIGTRLGMNLLEKNNIDNKTASETTLLLYKKLREIKGSERVVYRAYDKSDKIVNRQLIGRISKLGESYVVRVTVVEGESGKRLLDRTVTFSKDDDFNSVIGKIADQISNEDTVWDSNKAN